MPKIRLRKKRIENKTKKKEIHKLLYTEMINFGTIRLTSGTFSFTKKVNLFIISDFTQQCEMQSANYNYVASVLFLISRGSCARRPARQGTRCAFMVCASTRHARTRSRFSPPFCLDSRTCEPQESATAPFFSVLMPVPALLLLSNVYTSHAAIVYASHAAIVYTSHAAIVCASHAAIVCASHATIVYTSHAAIVYASHAAIVCASHAAILSVPPMLLLLSVPAQ